jgi:hypothetical protein
MPGDESLLALFCQCGLIKAMRIIVIDGFHKGHVINLPHPAPTITLVKPKTITVCDCDEPDISNHDFAASQITYQCVFKSIDGKVALYSQSGDSMAIFESGFDHVWRDKPWGKHEVLYFGCQDYGAWQ